MHIYTNISKQQFLAFKTLDQTGLRIKSGEFKGTEKQARKFEGGVVLFLLLQGI